MGKAKRKGPTLEEELDKPWCYYCDRSFVDMKVLVDHQKLKHFKCYMCPRRLDTAGGLAVHLQQVHKETLERIENTLPGREDPNIEIFGTEGVPADAMLLHQQDVMSRFKEQEAAQRQAPGGVTNDVPPAKKVKVESKEELKARLAAHKAKKAAQAAAAANGTAVSTPKSESPQSAVAEPQPSSQPQVAPPAAAPFSFAGPPPPSQHQAPGYNPAYSPPPGAHGYGPPQPQYPPQGYPYQAPYGMSGSPVPQNGPGFPGYGAPQQPSYVPQQSPPQYGAPFGGPPGGPWHGSPPMGGPPMGGPPMGGPQMGMGMPYGNPYQNGPSAPYGGPPMHGAGHPGGRFPPHGSPNLAGGPFPPNGHTPPQQHQSQPPHSRQNSLPAASSLPPRPAFDVQPVSRSQMNDLHSGHKIPSSGNDIHAAKHINDNVDDDAILAMINQVKGETEQQRNGVKHVTESPKVAQGADQENIKNLGETAAIGEADEQKAASKSAAKVKKPQRLIVRDLNMSPEEKMAKMPRYASPRKSSGIAA